MVKAFALIAISLTLSMPLEAQQAGSPVGSVLSGQIPAAGARRNTPKNYRLITEYTTLGPQGMEIATHVLTADFWSDDKSVQWTVVTVGQSPGHGQQPTSVEHVGYVENFKYARDAHIITSPTFFQSFPANANDQRNLIWDELMFHSFVTYLDRLRLNEPIVAQSGDVNLAGSGTFRNRQIELTLTGVGRWNGEDCFLIHYEAILNRFTIKGEGVTVAGRSDYFGDIWVAIRTREIEHGTLLEEVAGVVGNVPGSSGPQPLHVLRVAGLERLSMNAHKDEPAAH